MSRVDPSEGERTGRRPDPAGPDSTGPDSARAGTVSRETGPNGADTLPRDTRPVVLIDSSIYIYRAWQAASPASLDPEGRPTGAVAGFAATLVDLLTRERPDRVLCAFDICGRTGLRNTIHPGYKRSRPAPSAALVEQFPRCMTLARALGLAAIGSRSVEADDIIAHFAALARREDRPVTVVSGDKDLARDVTEAGDTYWDFGRHARQDPKALERRLGVRPAQIPDWLALSGDASDDIPGVPGVGAATAARLIRKWGSLDVLYAHVADVARMRFRGAPGVARLLAEHESTVRLARRLTGPLEDPELPGTLDPLVRRPVSREAARAALLAAGLDTSRSDLGSSALVAVDAR